jgi:hypothetical protein
MRPQLTPLDLAEEANRTFEEYSEIRYFLFTECNVGVAADCTSPAICNANNVCEGKLRH